MISRRIGSLRYPYHSQMLLSGTIHAQSERSKSAIRHRILQSIHATPLPICYSIKAVIVSFLKTFNPDRTTGRATPISKDSGLPTHPLTAIPADATPQRFY